jgi:hypothetical protein
MGNQPIFLSVNAHVTRYRFGTRILNDCRQSDVDGSRTDGIGNVNFFGGEEIRHKFGD